MAFPGFSPDALKFLRALKRNNRREWFVPRKAEYERLLRDPMRELTEELGFVLKPEEPRLRFDPLRSVLRIYRDVRFSEDKSPYKSHAAANYSYGSKSVSGDTPGLYFHIEPGQVVTAGGLWMPNSLQLRAIRSAIASKPDTFLHVVRDPAWKRRFGEFGGEKLKRAPQGYPIDHPQIEWLLHKQFYLSGEYPEDIATSKKLLPTLLKDFRLMLPLLRWVTDTLGKVPQTKKPSASFLEAMDL